jgi:hypothetical protein
MGAHQMRSMMIKSSRTAGKENIRDFYACNFDPTKPYSSYRVKPAVSRKP